VAQLAVARGQENVPVAARPAVFGKILGIAESYRRLWRKQLRFGLEMEASRYTIGAVV